MLRRFIEAFNDDQRLAKFKVFTLLGLWVLANLIMGPEYR